MLSRQIFKINTDTGTWGDTGPAFSGAILQMRWNPTVPDTGGDLEIALLPTEGDTGEGFVWYSDNDCLGADFVKVPRQPQHGSDGAVDS